MAISLISQEDANKIVSVVLSETRKVAPRHIAPHIYATVRTRKDGGYSVKWEVDSSPDGPTPDARAREYGSGIHSSIAQYRKKYLIKPKKAKVLAFAWDTADVDALRSSRIAFWRRKKKFVDTDQDGEFSFPSYSSLPSFAGEAPDGRLMFNYVYHPGVEAENQGRGYLGLGFSRAQERVKEEILKSAKEDLGREIYKNLRFGRKNK